MVIVSVEDANKKLESALKALSGEDVPIAISRAINRTLQKGRTIVKKNIKSHYNIKEVDFAKALTVRTANKKMLQGNINASAKPISLSHFDPTFNTTVGGKAVQVTVKRKKNKETGKLEFINKQKNSKQGGTGVSFTISQGQPKNLPFAFLIKGGTAKAVFARGAYSGTNFIIRHQRKNKSGSDTPIAKMITASVFGSSQQADVQNKNIIDMTAFYEDRLTHEIEFLTKQIK